MGLFSKVKDKALKVWTSVKEGTAHVLEMIKEGVEYAARKIDIWSERAKEFIEEERERIAEMYERKAAEQRRKKYYSEVKRGKHKLKEEIPDIVLANECADYLRAKFSSGVENVMYQKTEEERVETIVEMVSEVSSIMDVNVHLEFDIPKCRDDMKTFGYYNRITNELHINMGFLTCDKPQLIAEQVYTVFHELNHARQWMIVQGTKDYGYSDERRIQLAHNFLYYIRPEVSDYAYISQPLEADSFGLEEKLKDAMKGLN